MIAQALVGNPQIARVAVVGESEPDEDPGLALARADSVIAFLHARGVARSRLAAQREHRPGHLVRFRLLSPFY